MNTTSDLAALVSKKKVRIAGQGQDVSSFQGLIYARDSVEIRNTTVMGAIVSKDDAATTELENVTAVNVPELANWDIEQHLTLEEAMESAAGGLVQNGTSASDPVGILEADDTFTELKPGNSRQLKLLAERLKADPPSPPSWNGHHWSFKVKTPDGFRDSPTSSATASDFLNARQNWGKYVLEHADENIILVDIFEANLNELMSISQRLEMLYHASMEAN